MTDTQTTSRRCGRPRAQRRQGMIFVIAMAIIVILSALLLVYAQEMRTESQASANQLSAAQAAAVEQGAEQWVLAQVETCTTPLSGNTIAANVGFGNTDLTTLPAAGLQVGGGYFWVLNPDPTQDQTQGYGIADEGAKLNLNNATPDQLILLPSITQEAADSVVDWVDPDENPTGTDGGESSYYGGLAEPYSAKNSAFDTVDELLLVKGVTPAMLWGVDLNRDGVVDAAEQQLPGGATGPAVTINGSTDRRGAANYLTVYTTNRSTTGGSQTTVVNGVPQRTTGLVNVNTASEPVLTAVLELAGMTQTDADTMVGQRTQSGITGASTDTSWVATALGQAKATQLRPFITGRSYQYSADIVAVSGNGRSFKRVRIVVDARTQPATIVYHKDLTDLGWPLPPDVRTSLRAGQGVPADATGTATPLSNANSLP